MIDTRTEKSLKEISLSISVVYRNIIENATMYCVRPSGTKFWLYNNWVLAEWAVCQHSNPFETWNCKTEKAARELFDAATHNEQLED